jgi:hypothetical protein
MPLALITMNYLHCTFQIDVVDLSETYGHTVICQSFVRRPAILQKLFTFIGLENRN